jgi:hypothetical protein
MFGIEAGRSRTGMWSLCVLEHYIPMIQELSNDKSVPKFATHLCISPVRVTLKK